MYDEAAIERTTIDDPEKCQVAECLNKGAILNEDENGNLIRAKHCRYHGGSAEQRKYKSEELRNYRLSKFRAQIIRLSNSSEIKSLREEIGILRCMIEQKWNSLETENDLLIHSEEIAELLLKVERLVVSCHKIENAMGELLDKQAILNFAQRMVAIINEEVKDTETLTRITEKILKTVSEIGENS